SAPDPRAPRRLGTMNPAMDAATDTAMNAASVGIEVRGLSVVYGHFVAVADTSFRVAPGESFGIVGESGSGKTTVLRAICGLAPRSGGSGALRRRTAAGGS